MRYFLIEAELSAQHPTSGANYKTFMVKDKTYEMAVERVSMKIGVSGKFKLLACYEPTELDKNVHVRVG
jgi:hypothetical protein